MRESGLNRAIRCLSVTLGVLVALFGVLLALRLGGGQQTPAAVEATVAPSATAGFRSAGEDALFSVPAAVLLDASGGQVPFSSLAGTPFVLYFFSSWCPDCQAYEEEFARVSSALRADGTAVYAVCRLNVRGETADSARAAGTSLPAGVVLLMDPDATLYRALGLTEVPSVAFFGASGRYMTSAAHPDAARASACARYAAGGASAQTEAFLTTWLLDADGGVRSRYTAGDGAVRAEPAYLSESQGLVMSYAVSKGDRTLLDQVWGFVQSRLSLDGLVAWRYQDGEKAQTDAAVDDLRILSALLGAEDTFGGYAQYAAALSDALYDKLLRGGVLCDFRDASAGRQADTLTLCQADLRTLAALAAADARWDKVLAGEQAAVAGGYLSDAFPLYAPRYHIDAGTWERGKLQTTEALITVEHLAEAGLAKAETLDYLERLLENGRVYAAYNPDGTVPQGSETESTACYAILARIALRAGRYGMLRRALARMEAWRDFSGGALCGGYGSDGTLYAFDLLSALETWQAVEQSGWLDAGEANAT